MEDRITLFFKLKSNCYTKWFIYTCKGLFFLFLNLLMKDAVLEFSPGPIRAEDGDRGINTPLIYSILSGQSSSSLSVCRQQCFNTILRLCLLSFSLSQTITITEEMDLIDHQTCSVLQKKKRLLNLSSMCSKMVFKKYYSILHPQESYWSLHYQWSIKCKHTTGFVVIDIITIVNFIQVTLMTTQLGWWILVLNTL